ncbi:MIF4G domain-containing protein / MA3 domain-containing protein [Striga hermonthica]|uniref:MIF4G domain-containing protein / MA3 domain-containing protein n=1 Tax=Striga hermonthica TaxID=68872 RepID=A0A9N7MRL5_STRHE|nr:MIF4G domain-containing protein / MA3 domain-containing protein [Striga hermonthica]
MTEVRHGWERKREKDDESRSTRREERDRDSEREAETEKNGHEARKDDSDRGKLRPEDSDREGSRRNRDYRIDDSRIRQKEKYRSRKSDLAREIEEDEGEYRRREDRRSRYNDREDDRNDRRSRYNDREDDKNDREDDREERKRDRNRERGKRSEKDESKNGSGKKGEESENNVPVDAIANMGRSGGVYIPPFKLARMMGDIQDKSSLDYQRMTWDALKKSINGLVNKVNATNVKNIIPELFAENLIRGRGLFCQSCMKSQLASPGFTDVFAALVAVVNTKFPEIGDLLLRRIIEQLQKSYKRNDKPRLLAVVKFIAHLVNQQVVHELIALELLTLLLEKPTDDSVEVAVGFVTECGSLLQDLSPRGLHGIFERFRGILHEGEIDKRVQFLIEGLFALRKAKFQGYPAVRPELDLVEQEDQLTHEVSLLDEIDPETSLNLFKPDPHFLENEKRYEELKKQILGEESEDNADSDNDADSDDEDDEESEEEDEEQMKIKDETETNLINLRRTIYLTIMSSVDFEEAGHKLLKIKLEPGQEMELCIMLLECCSQERTYLRYYGLLGQRFCMINKVHQENFEKSFVQQYSMIHRLETNKLRNVAKFFAHLLGTDALPWHVLAYIRLTEEDTTSSSRIFIKILFQELSEHLGIRLLNERLNDPAMQDSFESIFPKDTPKNTRFAINFFTSIGLGGITENMREYLKNMPRLIMQQNREVPEQDSDSDSSGSGSDKSGSGSGSSSSGSSESESETDSEDRPAPPPSQAAARLLCCRNFTSPLPHIRRLRPPSYTFTSRCLASDMIMSIPPSQSSSSHLRHPAVVHPSPTIFSLLRHRILRRRSRRVVCRQPVSANSSCITPQCRPILVGVDFQATVVGGGRDGCSSAVPPPTADHHPATRQSVILSPARSLRAITSRLTHATERTLLEEFGDVRREDIDNMRTTA